MVQAADGWELVVNTHGKILAFDPTTGERLWSCDAIDYYIVPSIVAHDGIVYAMGGRKNTTIAVRAGGRGDVTDSHKLWQIKKGSNVSSPVVHEGHLYWASETKGVLYCVDIETGNRMFEDIDPHDYDKVNDVNANGAFLCLHAALKVMRPPKTGTIINIVSLG